MRKPTAAPLPDIDDEVFKQRLAPLARAVLPAVSRGTPTDEDVGQPMAREADVPDIRKPGSQALIEVETRAPVVSEADPAPRPTRGPRRGVEFLLPERVVIALKTEAAQKGTSMSVRVLEILRDAGYPVTDQDFIDLRKLPRR